MSFESITFILGHCVSFLFSRAPATSPLSSSSCFSIDHPVINSQSFSFVSHYPPALYHPHPLLALRQKSPAYVQVDHKDIPFLPPLVLHPHFLYSHLSLLCLFVPVSNSFPGSIPLLLFPVNGLISFYAGAQQINRYCIMAKTGKAPLCP